MSLIAIGDIHGCVATLNDLLRLLAPSREDHLIFIGDYIDRGPDSKGVIDLCLRLKAEHECTFLRGNHEAAMLSHLAGVDTTTWLHHGGAATLLSYMDGRKRVVMPREHMAFLQETRLFHDTPSFFFVHAGVCPERSIEENIRHLDEDVFLMGRAHLTAKHVAWEKTVVFGHTPVPAPLFRDGMIAIDTGCVYPARPGLGRLTAVRLPQYEFVDVAYKESSAPNHRPTRSVGRSGPISTK